jgi:hypothetical protein
MGKGKKPVVITLKETRHKTQPWKVIVDDPSNGPTMELKERYARKWTALRGGLRKVGAVTLYTERPVNSAGADMTDYWAVNDRRIQIKTQPLKK